MQNNTKKLALVFIRIEEPMPKQLGIRRARLVSH
jgi:hypothetical protein